MNTSETFYIDRLAEELQARRRRNPAYTMRAFARQLGLAAPVLSEVLRKKRRLPKAQVPRVVQKLALSPVEAHLFQNSALTSRRGLRSLANLRVSESDYRVLDEERNFRIIAEWEYYAIFELVDTGDFSHEPAWIAKRLDISEARAKTALKYLIESELLVRDSGGRLQKSAKQLTTSQDLQSNALRKSHLETLEMAAKKLESIAIEDRFYSSSTITIDRAKVEEAKDLIREFRKRLTALLSAGPRNEVYQFACQFFPLTNLSKKPKGYRKS